MIALPNRVHRAALAAAIAVAVAALAPPTAQAAEADEIEAEYQRARVFCLTGLTHQARADCLREAAAARDEARRGALRDEEPPSEYLENALRRCQRLPEADRADCEKRVRGEGTSRGSVEQGGIYRETVTTVPAPADTTR